MILNTKTAMRIINNTYNKFRAASSHVVDTERISKKTSGESKMKKC